MLVVVQGKARVEKWLKAWLDDMLWRASACLPRKLQTLVGLRLKRGVRGARDPTFNACKRPKKAVPPRFVQLRSKVKVHDRLMDGVMLLVSVIRDLLEHL